jgi:uncharacterized protein
MPQVVAAGGAVQIMKLSTIVVACAAIATALPLRAFNDAIPPAGLPSATEYSAGLLPAMDGTVSWRTLAEIEVVSVEGKLVPKFSNEILSLDKKDIRLYGFIIPLNLGRDQKHFLISAVPSDCAFCMPAGSEAIVEVLSKKPVEYGLEPVLVTGKLAVLRDHPNGLLYRMTDAMPVAISAPGKR